MRRFLVNRDFARLWYGQAISTIGDYVFDTTLVIWVAKVLFADSHWAPAAVSGLLLCTLAGTMLVGPVAGVFVDRWERRRTMLGTEVVRGVAVGALTLVMLMPRHALPAGVWLGLLYVVVFLVNGAGQFFNPARVAVIGDIVPGEADRTKAFGLGQATTATAAIVGPPLAAPLLFSVGVQWALLVNALSYVASYFAVRSVRLPAAEPVPAPAGKASWRKDFAVGLRMFAGNRFLVALLTMAVVAQLGSGALNALDIFFITDNLHAAPKLLGLVSMALGIGSVVGALLAGQVARILNPRNLCWFGMVLSGLFIGLYARQTHLAVALFAIFLVGVPLAALNAGVYPMMLAVTPKEYMGRMMAVFNPVNMAASTTSVVVAGFLASTVLRDFHGTVTGVHIGRIDTIFTVSALLIVAAGVYGYFALPPAGTRVAEPEPISEVSPVA
jgi:MFS family permease